MSLLAGLFARHWEWVLIALLAFGGWQLVQRLTDKVAVLELTQQQLGDTRQQLEQAHRATERASAALAQRERTLHALRQHTETQRARLRAIPDDGCVDRAMPADVIRLFEPPRINQVGQLVHPGVAAPAAPDANPGRTHLASSHRLHPAPARDAGHERSGQGGRAGALHGG